MKQQVYLHLITLYILLSGSCTFSMDKVTFGVDLCFSETNEYVKLTVFAPVLKRIGINITYTLTNKNLNILRKDNFTVSLAPVPADNFKDSVVNTILAQQSQKFITRAVQSIPKDPKQHKATIYQLLLEHKPYLQNLEGQLYHPNQLVQSSYKQKTKELLDIITLLENDENVYKTIIQPS